MFSEIGLMFHYLYLVRCPLPWQFLLSEIDTSFRDNLLVLIAEYIEYRLRLSL